MDEEIIIEKYFCNGCKGDCLLSQIVKDISGASTIMTASIMLRLVGELIQYSKPEDVEKDGELIITDQICGGMVFCTDHIERQEE
jgi:hypothetical protein